MSPNEVATLLINMHKPKSSFDILQKEMMDLVRLPGEDLESCKLALLKSLATTMYNLKKQGLFENRIRNGVVTL